MIGSDLFERKYLSKYVFYKFKNSNAGYVELIVNKYWIVKVTDEEYAVVSQEELFQNLSSEDKINFMYHIDEFDYVYKYSLGFNYCVKMIGGEYRWCNAFTDQKALKNGLKTV